MNFEQGKPACPVACQYCFITEHDERRALWNRNPVAGVNRASLFINVTPDIATDPVEQARFALLPWEVAKGEVFGFTAVTDPLWPRLEPWLEQ